MQNQDLPDYKQTFLSEMQQLRRQQEEAEALNKLGQTQFQQAQKTHTPLENNILNASQYSSPLWRQTLNQTTTGRNHNETHFDLNKLMNPEVNRKQNNIRLTQITEYSNAKHNNTVFINPKTTSC